MVEIAEATKPDGGESLDKDANEAVASALPPAPPTEALASVSLHIWPPSQRTRDAVIQHMVETVTASSILSKRYGVLPHEEASATARLIEEEAFAAAAAAADATGGKATSVDDEIEILQIYSKEVSSRMMKAIKERGSSTSYSPTVADAAATPVPVDSSASSSLTVADAAAAKVTPVPVDSSASDIGVGEESASQQV